MRTPVRIYAEVIKPLADGVKLPQLASVCFITDTGECQGNSFGDGEDYPAGGRPDWTLDNNKKCREEGYTLTSCFSVQTPFNHCPYNENIFEKCVCKPGLVFCPPGQTGVGESCDGKYASCQCDPKLVSCNALQNGQGASCGGKFERCVCKPSLVTCTEPSVGVGEACNGKYVSCCSNACQSGYDLNNGICRQLSSIKTECGNKCYKILDNTCKSGSLSAPAESGGYKNKIVSYTDCSNPCFQSFNDNCPSGYVKTKAGSKCYETTVKYTAYGSPCYKEISCCDERIYKYVCTGSNQAGGSGASCDGKYQKCSCVNGYIWNAESGICVCAGTDWCTLDQNCGAMGYKQQSCSGKVLKCPYDLNYVFCL